MYKTLLMCSALLLATANVVADDVVTLDDYLVTTATRTATPKDDALSSIKVITRADIDNAQARDLAELLRFKAGIDIARNGGPGQATSLFIRGTESNHTLVLIDGVRVNPGTIGGAAVQNIAPSLIERIEIVTGPRSSLYGSDAIGGVINIITRTGGDESSLTLRAGSNNLQQGAANFSGGNDNIKLSAALDYQGTDGFAPRTFTDEDRGYENLSLNLQARFEQENGAVTLRHWRADGNTEYVDFFSAPVDQDYSNQVSALTWESELTDSWQSTLSLSHMQDDVRQNQAADFVESTRVSADWQNTVALDAHTLVAGVYTYRESAKALSFGSGFDEDTDMNAVYLQDQISFGATNILLAARLSDHDAFGSELTWNSELGFALNDAWRLQFNAGRAFRAPDASDRFGFGGTPTLEAEVSNQWQTRVLYQPAANYSLGLEFFNNDIRDLIDFDFATFTLQNISKAEIRGAELSGKWWNDEWQIEMIAVNQSADDATTGERLLRRAEQSLSINTTRTIGQHAVALHVLATGDRVDFGPTPLPGYVIASLSGRLQLSEQWQLAARVENLTDAQYETASTYRSAGREATIALTYRWR